MASILIRDLPEEVKSSLRIQAARCGKSLEAYARNILQTASRSQAEQGADIAMLASLYFGEDHGIELDIPERGTGRDQVSF